MNWVIDEAQALLRRRADRADRRSIVGSIKSNIVAP